MSEGANSNMDIKTPLVELSVLRGHVVVTAGDGERWTIAQVSDFISRLRREKEDAEERAIGLREVLDDHRSRSKEAERERDRAISLLRMLHHVCEDYFDDPAEASVEKECGEFLADLTNEDTQHKA